MYDDNQMLQSMHDEHQMQQSLQMDSDGTRQWGSYSCGSRTQAHPWISLGVTDHVQSSTSSQFSTLGSSGVDVAGFATIECKSMCSPSLQASRASLADKAAI